MLFHLVDDSGPSSKRKHAIVRNFVRLGCGVSEDGRIKSGG